MDSDDEDSGIPLEVGLSAATLAALMQFAKPQNDNGEDESENKVSVSMDQKRPDPERSPTDLEATHVSNALEELSRDGVVRLNNLLSVELCGRCKEQINSLLAVKVASAADQFIDGQETGFGNVDVPTCRWDMYLDHEGAVEESLASILAPTADAGMTYTPTHTHTHLCHLPPVYSL
jgi:hypothetical protein